MAEMLTSEQREYCAEVLREFCGGPVAAIASLAASDAARAKRIAELVREVDALQDSHTECEMRLYHLQGLVKEWQEAGNACDASTDIEVFARHMLAVDTLLAYEAP